MTDLVLTDQWLAQIEAILWPDGPRQNIWMILDGARSIEVFRFLLECHLEYSCLYSGPLAPDLEMAAPYLVQLDHGYRDTHRLIRRAWGNSWGVFLRTLPLRPEAFNRSEYGPQFSRLAGR